MDKQTRKGKEALENKFISESLAMFKSYNPEEKSTIGNILDTFKENSFILSLLFFTIPVAIPLPYPPGFTTAMGIPVIVLSIQMMLGFEKVYLPQRILSYKVSNKILIMIADKSVPKIQVIEKILKPRLKFASNVVGEQIIGFMSLISAISIAIPLPMTNSIPAFSIVVMCLGLIKHDGLVIIGGIVISIIGNLIALIVTLTAGAGLKSLFLYIYNILN